MGPTNKQWIRGRMAGIKKAAGIAFSEEIFLSILICLIAKNKHLVLHTFPEAVPELKSVVEQHCAVVFGLTTATIVCHGHQTKTDIIGAITGRHADMATHTNGVSSAQYPYSTHTSIASHHHHHPSSLHGPHHHHQTTPSGHYYQYSNPGDEYSQRSKSRLEKSRRSVATNYSEASEISHRVSENQHHHSSQHHQHHHQTTPSIASVRTSERDSRQLQGYHLQGGEDPGDDASSVATTLRRSDSRTKGSGRPGTSMSQVAQENTPMETLGNNKRPTNQFLQTPVHMTGGTSTGGSGSVVGKGPGSIHSSHAPVTPVDFTFPRRRHESVSIQGGYGQGGGGELPTGVTYGGRKIAQAIILDGLENASQEVYAVLLEMIINKGINDRNRYELPDLIIIAIFSSQNVPDNIPKQLLDYFAINCSYLYSIPQPRAPPPPRRHAHFRRTDWDELSKRMKAVTVSNDMMRYIRDVIVGVRTHEAVHGGLTARAALDLELIMKTLAAIFQTTFVTPEMLVTAAEKVFSHRLQLKSTRRKKLLQVNNYYNNNSNNNSNNTNDNDNTGTHHPGSSMRPHSLPPSHGKTPLHGSRAPSFPLGHKESFGSSARQKQQPQEGINDDASFVELSDSEETSSSSSVHQAPSSQPQRSQHPKSGETQSLYMDELALEDTEKTAADVVKDVLKAVYPPI